MDHQQNKVFINPNFKRVHSSSSQSSLHLNPNFRQQSLHTQQTVSNKTRIFVNPNFIRPNTSDRIQYNKPTLVSIENSTMINTLTNQINSVQTLQNNNPATLPLHTVPVNNKPSSSSYPITKSRYCLVRHNNENNKTESQPEKVATTFKVNKYKSVPILDIKKSLNANKSLDKHIYKLTARQKNPQVLTPRCKKDISSTMHNTLGSRFKFIKNNTESKTKVIRRSPGNLPKNVQQSLRTKMNKKHFKTNHIPCPLFRKYGKCLRHTNGYCEFLHDKKHVSICRRFLIGTCHVEQCLLSHDVTTNKMPTCSFYLKGMCTKEGCPYLHVKLNEKTKICTDFLKGYCEKGDNCLNRHVNICPDMASKGVCSRKQCPYPHKCNKIQSKNIKIKARILNRSNKSNPQIRRISKSENKDTHYDNDIATCSRYYKEVTTNHTSANEICEVIKPMRCKLGTLPSFIQL